MLIISKFHDYYDTALAHGVDKACVYQRESKFFNPPTNDLKPWGWPKRQWANEKEFLFQCVVGFAGKLFPMILWTDTHYGMSQDFTQEGTQATFLYDMETCTELLDEKYPEHRKIASARKYAHRWELDISDGGIEAFFNTNTHRKYEGVFVEHKVPLFVAFANWRGGNSLEGNTELKPIKFMKVRDPYTAFQEIHMFMSGVIGMADRDTAEVGNDDRITQRGFDEWSFRKEPGEKQRKGKPKKKPK